MESNKQEKREINPRQTANILSKITFWYTRPLFAKGLKRDLEEEDLYDIIPELETHKLGECMEKEWNLQKHRTHAMLIVFWKLIGKPHLLLSMATLITVAINVVRPIIIGRLVFYFTPGQNELSKVDAYLYSVLLIGLHIVDVYNRQNYYFAVETLALKFRTAICSLIYTKCLRLSASQLRHISFAKITNLITRDINIFELFFYNMTVAFSGLISLIIICYYMYNNIGVPTVVMITTIAIFLPFVVSVGIWTASIKKGTSEKTDFRINSFQKVLSNIRSTKMYVWEKYFEQKILSTRKEEMTILLKMFNLLFFTIAIAIIFYNVTFYLTLMTHVWFGIPINAEKMYFITGVVFSLTFYLGTIFPYTSFYSAQVIAALKRMQDFLQKLEVEVTKPLKMIQSHHPKIKMYNVTVKIDQKPILNNLNIEIKSGLTLVMGHASSGKSVFLMTILKEFEISSGELLTEGKFSYVSQEPWLFPSTIRQNIIFGSKFEELRYQQVITACALQYDFDTLENGDSTIIADRGINLSKGQQSRINLARAVYKKCDIYLLDDCLSSLDSLVANFIFINCILNFLHDRLVILVSHNLNLVPFATNVVKLEKGTTKVEINNLPKKAELICEEPIFCNKNFEIPHREDGDGEEKALISHQKNKNKIYGEDKKTGAVSLQIYKAYIDLGGGVYYALMIFCLFIITQFFLSYKDKLISQWANIEDEISKYNNSSMVKSSQYFILIEQRSILLYHYTGTIIGISVATLIRGYSLFVLSKRVSINLHKKMLHSVLHAVLKFYDSTFIGNVVNRFSKDLVTVDETLPFPLLHLIAIVFETTGSFLLISSTNIRFLIPMVVLFICVIILRTVYLKTGRPLKRLDASTKSPVIGYLNSTLEGLLTIKVFQAEDLLKKEFERHHDLYNSASYSHLCCMQAYVLATDNFVAIFITVVILQFVVFDQGVLPGDVGLAISQSFMLGTILYFAFYKLADLETQMTSVERAVDYIDIEQEKKTGLTLEQWPKCAEIKYENVSLAVNNSKSFSLKNINFFIPSKGKIGIVGRTGAGKSSIISVLFRLYEFTGKITIDDVDIKTLSLDFLRTKISVIPQDPVLFNGTLRENIDLEGKYEDEVIWKAIDTVKLKTLIPTLNTNVKNLDFTCGQTQLICLARVLVKKNKILVLDELVENVDSDTENLIYSIINENFSSCTVIKIAHKLKFVMDCDKILVLNNSEMVEYDSPHVLLNNKNSLFYKMVQTANMEFVNNN